MLERATPSGPEGPFLKRHRGTVLALAAGAVSLVAAFLMQFATSREVTELPNPLVTVPLLFAAAAGVGLAFLRREAQRPFAIAGLGMAAAAVALGWVVVAAAVAAVAAVICLILAKFL